MRIKKVSVKNFRQFYGSQEIEFPVSGQKNVTLIHAENGFGKTSILNAVLWALFKQVTPKFERPEDIVNYEASEEGETTALVEVLFEFKDQDYLIQRTHHQQWEGREKTDLLAFKIQDGNSKLLNAPETFTSSVIPPEMAKYFFFDGEAAESFAAARNYKEIESAIRNILGCSLAETAIADLRELSKTVDREIGNVSGDAKIETLENQIAAKTKEIETAVSLREQTVDNITTWKDQLAQIVQGLRKMQGVEEIQKQRDDKVAQKSEADSEIRSCEEEILKWIGQRSIQVISKRISQVTLDFIDEASLRGRIPSPYNEDFVKGLLSEGICVCHRPLPAGTPEWKSVAELLKTASNAEVLGRVVRVRARTQLLKDEGASAPKALAALQGKLVKHLALRARLEQEIEELGTKIEGLPVKEIAERERSRRILEEKVEKEREKLGGVKAHLVTLEKAKAEMEDELEELARNNKRTKRLLAKRHLLARSAALLKGLLETYEKDARAQIESEINNILETVAHKDYRCRFNENFALELILNERATPKSGGENQLLSLAFIASLVKFAASRINASDLILKPGTMAPLVLDAPLGQLDPSYQESVAEFLPKLAHQVVLLVSGSQGGEAVLEALQPHVAAEYVLIQENRGPLGKKKQLKCVLRNKERDLILYNCPRNMTHIERL
jgi:chromosome segregation ATPase